MFYKIENYIHEPAFSIAFPLQSAILKKTLAAGTL